MGSTPTSTAKGEGAIWSAGERLSCWQCGSEHAPDLFCPACSAIQPIPEQADYFAILGLPRRLTVDAEALQQRYYDLHRRLHPDRYQTGPQPARVASLRNTAAVNRAYRTLRDPVDRGLYWLALRGESLGANNNKVPAELAELVFEVHEQLEELYATRGRNGDGKLERAVAAAHGELLQRQTGLLQELQENFARWDSGNSEATVLTQELKRILAALAYLGTLIRDVEKELET